MNNGENTLMTYNFNTSPIRVVAIDGKPWFVAIDACKVLGFEIARRGAWHTLRNLDASEKQLLNTPRQGRGNPNLVFISESGLYKLVMRSDKPAAKPFQD